MVITYEPINTNRIQCVREAVITLSQHNISIINRFIKSINIYSDEIKKKNKEGKLQLIEERVYRNKDRCEKLYDYNDDLKMMGNQHIFLFSINAKDLIQIKDLKKISKANNLELAERSENPLYVWKSDSPQLAKVTTIKNNGGISCITLKWNQTREYKKLLGNTYETLKERVSDFFILNLQESTAQLRLQCLPTGSFKDAQIRYGNYLTIINDLIGFHNMFPIFLEPIMQKIFHKNLLPVTNWYIKSKLGNIKGNKGNQILLQRLRLFLFNYFLHSIRVYWAYNLRKGSEKRLYFELNSFVNSISFESITDQTRIDFILDKIRMIKVSQKEFYKIQIKELAEFAKDDEDIRPIFIIDYYIKRWKKRKIKSNEFANETGFVEKNISEIFNKLAKKYPKRFTVYKKNGYTILEITTVSHDGIVDILTKKTNNKQTKKIIKRAGIPVIVILAGLFMTLFTWGFEEQFQKITKIPFVVVEVIPFVLMLFRYYGGKRVKKYLISPPVEIIIKITKSLARIKPDSNFDIKLFIEQYQEFKKRRDGLVVKNNS